MLNKVPTLLQNIQSLIKEAWLLVVVVFTVGVQWTQFNSRLSNLEEEIPKIKPVVDTNKALSDRLEASVTSSSGTITSFNDLKSTYVREFSDLESRLEALFGPRNRLEDGLIKKMLVRIEALEAQLGNDPQHRVGDREKNKRGQR